MKRRTPPRKADAILTGDWHLREDTPICRTDDYWSEQWRKIGFIKDLQREHGCPVIQPGDFFDHWKPSPRLIAWTFTHLPADIMAIYGNHDLPQHSLDLKEKCGLFAVAAGTSRLRILEAVHWGQEPTEASAVRIGGRRMLVWHVPVYENDPPPWHEQAFSAVDILDRFPGYDLIVTGDLHQRFVVAREGRLLVNAGSIMRMTADQIGHRPAVYLWYADENEVSEVEIPVNQGVISREHIDKKKDRESRYAAFIERVRNEGRPELDFLSNLERHFAANDTPRSVRQIIYEALEVDHE